MSVAHKYINVHIMGLSYVHRLFDTTINAQNKRLALPATWLLVLPGLLWLLVGQQVHSTKPRFL